MSTSIQNTRPHRGTILSVEGRVITQESWPGEQYVLRIRAPELARRAKAGAFVHVRCSHDIPMRRPLSIQRADAADGWIEVLYKVVGQGLGALRRLTAGDPVALLGPIGNGFQPDPARPHAVLIGGGVGVPPLLFLAEALVGARSGNATDVVCFFGSELPFPFPLVPSRLPLPGVPAAATASLALTEEWGVAVRLASNADIPGSYRGYVTELAEKWLAERSAADRSRMTIYACGPEAMLKAAQRLAVRYELPTQLCLEEFMACAVGGCAGCVVPVQVNGQRAMKRVCVDGPVFDGATIYPAPA